MNVLATKPGMTQTTLNENLEHTARHPVLIFGASRAGKSTLIVSFIEALRVSGEVAVSLGDPVLDVSDPRSAEKHTVATRLYERQTYLHDSGIPAPATQVEPFFVPVDVTPKNSQLAPVKFAFLDGRGENYQPNQDENENFYRAFSPEVQDLLENFSHSISIIYVAPYSSGTGHDRDTRDSNFGLLGVIDGYRKVRQMRRSDFHLFLLSKWDQCVSPLDVNGKFESPSAVDVSRVLDERYKQAWGAFQALPLEGPAQGRRAFSQYTAGYFRQSRPAPAPDNLEKAFRRYPRTVLNWLYGNATQFRFAVDNQTFKARKVLFDDVVAPDTSGVSMSERLASWLTAR
jgi:hypothetical protein